MSVTPKRRVSPQREILRVVHRTHRKVHEILAILRKISPDFSKEDATVRSMTKKISAAGKRIPSPGPLTTNLKIKEQNKMPPTSREQFDADLATAQAGQADYIAAVDAFLALQPVLDLTAEDDSVKAGAQAIADAKARLPQP